MVLLIANPACAQTASSPEPASAPAPNATKPAQLPSGDAPVTSPSSGTGASTEKKSPEGGTPQEPISVELFYWLTNAQPRLSGGAANTATTLTGINFTGTGHSSPGLVLSIPAGLGNSLRFTYFQTAGAGNQSAIGNLTLFATGFGTGDYLATRYKVQAAKLSLDFLSYPTPLNNSSWRFRTLWEVQYVTVNSSVDAPLKAISYDSDGNAISNTGVGTRSFIYPTLGIAMDKRFGKHFRVEGRGSGFGVPHRADIWDAEGTATFSLKQLDIIAAYKGFHFKTSPKSDQYLAETLKGAYVGVRWNLK